MKPDPSPEAVGRRLSWLRAHATVETEAEVRVRLARERPPPPPFEVLVARRLEELRALDDLTRHLHARPRTGK